MREVLTPEQHYGAAFLAERSVAMLADGVGYGKTAQIARACDLVMASRITAIVPPILRVNTTRQFDEWSLFGYPSTVIKTAKDKIPADGLVVVSCDLIHVPRVKKALADRGCDVLILDEAHRFKTPGAKRTKACFSKNGIASTAAHVWFVTGEPTPNNASEHYVFAKLCGAWAGRFDDFVRRFCVTVDTNFGLKIIPYEPGKNAEADARRAELKGLLRPHMLARTGIDPSRGPLIVDEIAVDGKRPDFSEIDPDTLERIERAALAGDWALLNDSFFATVRRCVGVAKAEAVAELAAGEFDAGAGKMLVFCAHTTVIDTIAARLERYGCGVIDGRTSGTRRQTLIDQFQGSIGGPRVIVAHTRSAGEGLTLTAANRVLLAEPSWSPAENTQAIARSWRRGQKFPVRASFCYLPGSIDDLLGRTLARKTKDVMQLRVSAHEN